MTFAAPPEEAPPLDPDDPPHDERDAATARALSTAASRRKRDMLSPLRVEQFHGVDSSKILRAGKALRITAIVAHSGGFPESGERHAII